MTNELVELVPRQRLDANVLFIAIVLALEAAVIRVILRSGSKSKAATVALFQDLAQKDEVLKVVEHWRLDYEPLTKQSMGFYYVFAGAALLATSAVTTIGAIGSAFPTARVPPGNLLLVTSILGFVATVATGIDRMLNDRKDFIRFGRYVNLLVVAMFNYAASLTAASVGESEARKSFIDSVAKLRTNETPDWIQDETSATVDAAGAGDARAVAVTRALQDISDARRALDSAKADAASAKTASDDADAARSTSTKALSDAKAASKSQAEIDAAQIASDEVEKAYTDKKQVFNRKQTALEQAQRAMVQAEAVLRRLMQ